MCTERIPLEQTYARLAKLDGAMDELAKLRGENERLRGAVIRENRRTGMATELAERLRFHGRQRIQEIGWAECTHIATEAADEMERLEAENASYRTRLATMENRIKATTEANEILAAQVAEAEKYNGWHQIACMEIERLRAALLKIDLWTDEPVSHASYIKAEIRAALNDKIAATPKDGG